MSKSALTSFLGTAAVLAAFSIAAPATAQEFHHDGGHGGPGPHGDFHGGPGGWHGDIHHFGEYDYGRWRGGHWFHGPHDGRDGWWWTVNGGWYYYPAPIYPYPDPYVPPEIVIPTAPPANMQYAYYCSAPAGYYPYVSQCLRPWHSRLIPVQSAPVMVPPPVMGPGPVMAPAPVMPPVAMPAGGQREIDDRQLNSFGAEFAGINANSPHARTRLKTLQAEVARFHEDLFHRSYNAMDILRDTEDLEHRISVKRVALGSKTAIVPAAPVGMPAPVMTPMAPPEAQPVPQPRAPQPGDEVIFTKPPSE